MATYTSQSQCILCRAALNRVLMRGRDHFVLQCNSCQLISVQPLPSRGEHKSFHDQQYFRRFYSESIEDFHARRGRLFLWETKMKASQLRLIESLTTKGRLLDVGTGQGLFPILAHQSGWEAWALDISTYTCSYLARLGLQVLCGYLEEVSLPEDYFDVITLWHCLEHTFNPLTTLESSLRALKPCGVLVIEVPRITTAEIFVRKLLRKSLFTLDLCEWHFYHFTPHTLSRLTEEAGFQVIQVGHRRLPRKTLKGWLIEAARNLASSTHLIDLRSTVFLVAKKPKTQFDQVR